MDSEYSSFSWSESPPASQRRLDKDTSRRSYPRACISPARLRHSTCGEPQRRFPQLDVFFYKLSENLINDPQFVPQWNTCQPVGFGLFRTRLVVNGRCTDRLNNGIVERFQRFV